MAALLNCSQCNGPTFAFVAEHTGGLCAECVADAHRDNARRIREDRERRKKRPPKNLPESVKEYAPQEFFDLLQTCDQYCVVDCCGLNACDLSPASISAWLATAGDAPLERLLSYFEGLATRMAFETRSVDFMTDPWPPPLLGLWAREFSELLRYCRRTCHSPDGSVIEE